MLNARLPCGGAMSCPLGPGPCRREHIAARLRDAVQDGTDWEACCPVCGHETFRVSAPERARWRNIWGCACRGHRRCQDADMRGALLALGVMPGCLGGYAASMKASTDPNMAARLDAISADILSAPHLKPSDMRILLAEARGDKVPEDQRDFVKWAIELGISRTRAYEAATRWCRPPDSPPGG